MPELREHERLQLSRASSGATLYEERPIPEPIPEVDR